MILAVSSLLLIDFLDNLSTTGNSLLVIVVFCLWLLFLPNAFYLLTDLMHLNPKVLVNKRDNKSDPSLNYERGDPLFILDSLLLFLTVFFGAVVGGLSLSILYDMLVTNFNEFRIYIFTSVLILSAVGVYIGRFGRWNSWDAVIKPTRVINDLIVTVKNPKLFKQFISVVFTITILEIISWLFVINYK
jgi:uncharacterized membrane protein